MLLQCCTKEKHDFVSKIFYKSGISTTMTALPASIQPVYTTEPKTDANNAQNEARMVYGQVITEVLKKTGEQCRSRIAWHQQPACKKAPWAATDSQGPLLTALLIWFWRCPLAYVADVIQKLL
jgi:hypothetical protein